MTEIRAASETTAERCRRNGWSFTEACDIGLDGYCYTHRTHNMAECANAEMDRSAQGRARP
jgi:hypothetical protein